MKASISIIKTFCTGLRLVTGRKRTSRLFSSAALLESSFLCPNEDEVSHLDESSFVNGQDYDLSPSAVELYNDLSLDFSENAMCETIRFKSPTSVNGELEKIKLILARLGWNSCYQKSSYDEIELDECNIIRILNDLCNESDAVLSFYFFRWSQWSTRSDHTVRSICTMVHILVAGNMNYRAVDLIIHLVKKNDGESWWLDFLFKVLHETHTDRRVLVTAYSMLVDCYVIENMVNAALILTSQMTKYNFFPSIGVCNKLLKALLQSDQIESAWKFLEDMQSQGLGVNVSLISLFVHKYCSKGNIESGWKLLIEMKNHGINPDIVAYTIIIDSLSKNSLLREATSLLFKIREMGISLDSVSISSVLDGFCKVGKTHKALSILKIFNLSPNIYVYNSFIARFCADSDIEAATDLFHEMSDLGFLPDCVSYTSIIGGFCKIRDTHSALKFLALMVKRAIKPSTTTYTTLMQAYCKCGDVDEAENIFHNMIGDGVVPDIIAYNTLMDCYGKKGLLHKAYKLLDRMKLSGISPDTVSYNCVIHSLVVRGFASEAKELTEELARRGFTPDVVTYTDLVSGFSKKKNFEEAFFVWFYMSDHQFKPDVVTCSALLSGYCKAKRMDEASALFNKMLNIGLVPDVILYNIMIRGFCGVGDVDKALEVVKLMVDNGINPNEVTHRALSLAYKKKWVLDPVQTAFLKIQQILLKSGVSTRAQGLNQRLHDAQRPNIMVELQKLVSEWPLEVINCQKEDERKAYAAALQEDIPAMASGLLSLGVKVNVDMEDLTKAGFQS